MIMSQCILRPSHYLSKNTSIRSIRPACRNISFTNAHIVRVPPSRSRHSTTISQILWSTRKTSTTPLGFTSLRFASTNNRSPPIAEVQSAYPSQNNQTGPGVVDSKIWTDSDTSGVFENQGSLETLFSDSQPQVNEYIGFLKEMGLDYGWGPTAFVETLLEHIHIYTGTPWWISVGLTVIAIRLFIFRFFINAQDASARIAAIKPLTAGIDKRQKDAVASGDQQELRAISLERRAIYSKFGIKVSRIFWPIALQVPLGFGTFRLMRGMTALPVPGFDQGGPLWLSDLTIADPYYILPLATAATYYWTFKLGGETGGATQNLSPTMHRLFLYFLPALTGLFAIWWPVGLQIPIFLNGIFAITQGSLFRQPWFRKLCNIQPLGKMRSSAEAFTLNRGPQAAKPAPKGFMDSIKRTYQETVEQGKKMVPKEPRSSTTGRTDNEKKKAKAYEEKMAREAAQRRFEAKQAKEAREEERRRRGNIH